MATLNSLAVGSKIRVAGAKKLNDEEIILQIASKENHPGYPAGHIPVITEKIIGLMAFDAKESKNSDSNRRSYGNNNYAQSNILQWLNSSKTSGWYAPTHAADAPPTGSDVTYNPYTDKAGFLSYFPAEFVAMLPSVNQTVNKPSVDGGGTEVVTSKVFLPSLSEVGLAVDGAVDGSKFDLFTTDASRIAKPTQGAIDNNTYTSTSLSKDKGWIWWLRSPYVAYASYARSVYSDGTRCYSFAFSGNYGVRPALALRSDFSVSGPDELGVYTLTLNNPPKITVTTQDNAVLHHGETLHLTGSYSDPDVGDVITANFSVNDGAAQVLDVKLNDGKPQTYDKVIKMMTTDDKADIIYNDKVIASGLEKDKTHTIRFWAHDDKGARSADEFRRFQVVPNRPPVITLTDVATVHDLSIVDTLSYKGNVIDLDGDDVTMTVDYGSGVNDVILDGNDFTVEIPIKSLRVGANNVKFVATDSFGVKSQKEVRTVLNSVVKQTDVTILRMQTDYEKEIDINKLQLWAKRAAEDNDIQLSVSPVADDGSPEEYVETTKKDSTSTIAGTVTHEDFFEYEQTDLTSGLVLKFSSVKGLKMILGATSGNPQEATRIDALEKTVDVMLNQKL